MRKYFFKLLLIDLAFQSFVFMFYCIHLACKYVAEEISENLLKKFNSHELIETGYSIDERLNKKKAKKYKDS